MKCGYQATEVANSSPICKKCCPLDVRFGVLAREKHPSYVAYKTKIPEYPFNETGYTFRW